MLKIDELILEATTEQNEAKLSACRAIKAAEQNFVTAKERVKDGKVLDDAVEIGIVKKLREEYTESAKLYKEAMDQANAKADYLKELLPPEVSQDDIIAAVIAWAVAESNGETIPKARMGEAIKAVKTKFPTADGKLVADCVKERLV